MAPVTTGMRPGEKGLVRWGSNEPVTGRRSERKPGRVRVALLPWMVAGVQTQYEHLRSHVPEDEIETLTFEVRPHLEGGFIEGLPLPQTMRGTLRSAYCTRQLFWNRVDAVWSQTDLPML